MNLTVTEMERDDEETTRIIVNTDIPFEDENAGAQAGYLIEGASGLLTAAQRVKDCGWDTDDDQETFTVPLSVIEDLYAAMALARGIQPNAS
jgi:hypothetical protein